MHDALLLAPAHRLADALRAGEVTSRALVEGYLARIARLDPALNAVIVVDADGARRDAEVADLLLRRAREGVGATLPPLAGVPITIKDMFAVAGLRTTYGFKALARHVPREDATVVARLRAAGAVVLGKTNIPEASFDWQCDSPVYGRTRNPWDPRRTPGGSSGGAAAAVAAGFSALDVGSDVAGSVRLPAHYCGIYGLKPTEYRVSGAGHGEVRDALHAEVSPLVPRRAIGERGVRGIRSIVSFGPLARSVRDLEIVLLAIAGADPRRPEVPPVPVARAHPRALGDYRLAYTEDVDDVPLDAATRRAMRELVARLEGAGARVERVPAPMDFLDACDVWGSVIGAEMGAALPHTVRIGLRTLFAVRFGAARWGRAFARGLSDSLHQLESALARRDAHIRAVEGLLARYDGWILPVSSTPAFEHCRTGGSLPVDGEAVAYGMAAGALVVPLSLTGHPVVSLPIGHSESGLPIGAQLVGRRWSDFELLALAGVVDGVAGQFRPPPGYE
ncbi:MAG TPA: amidase [Gemmatimonadaceae bacterium]|nr:amidase [Gemmatimonadaceae bacterium]